MKKLTDAQIADIIRLYKEGQTPTQIAQTHDLIRTSASRLLRNQGVLPAQRPRLAKATEQTICKKYTAGMPSDAIAKELSIDGSTVLRALKRNGATIRPVGGGKKFVPSKTVVRMGKKLAKRSNEEKYGSTFVPSFQGNMLTNEFLKTTSDDDKKLIAEEIFRFYRDGGFPYKELTGSELIEEFSKLTTRNPSSVPQEDGSLSISNQTGNDIILHFAPHFFEVLSGTDLSKKSMLDAFHDDKLLMKTIKNRLSNNYTICGNMIRQGLRNSKCAFNTSHYYPLMVRYLYQRFAPVSNSVIYDFSSGFGHRLLGALSLPYPITYIGADPFDKSFQSARDIAAFCQENFPGLNKTIDLRNMGSEDFCDPAYIGKVDLAFSSPPYFNLEVYSDQSSQAAFGNDYQFFLMQWWKKTVINISQLIKDDGFFLLNVKERVGNFLLGENMVNLAKEHGFVLQETLQIRLSQNNNFRTTKGAKKVIDQEKYEPIFVLRKPAAISASISETPPPPPSISSTTPQITTSPASGSREAV